MITVFINIYDEIALLPDAVAYYRAWGAERIVVSVCNGSLNKVWNDIGGLNLGEDVIRVPGQRGQYHDADLEAEDLNYYRECFDGWHVIADLDEFHWYGGMTFGQLADACEKAGASHVHSTVIDRVTRTLNMVPIHHCGTLYETFPMVCNLTEALGCNVNKAAFLKSGVHSAAGHHYAGGKPLGLEFETHHFKWNDKARQRIVNKLEGFKSRPKKWADEVVRAKAVVASGKIDPSALPTNTPAFTMREARNILP